jgi:hypothetical protein
MQMVGRMLPLKVVVVVVEKTQGEQKYDITLTPQMNISLTTDL